MSTKTGLNQLKAGATLSYISMGVGFVVSIIYTPIMLRILGQSEYGLYNLVASVVAYLGVINFGFGSAYMRYYSRYKVREDSEKIATLNGMFLVIFSVLGLIAVIAGGILTLNSEFIFGSELSSNELSRAKILMMILVANLAISFPNIIFTSHISANEKFIFQKIVQMVKAVVNPFVVLPILLMGYGSVGMVLATTTINIIIEVVNATYCLKTLKMRFSFKEFDFILMKEMMFFSMYIFINMVVDQINWNVDKFILGRFHGTTSVAVYGVAAQLNGYYITISTSISTVFIPRVHRLVANLASDDELTKLFTRIGRVQFIILSLVLTGLIFLGRPFISFWAGNNYDDSFLILIILIIPLTIPLIQNIGIEIQRAKNMHKFRSWVYLFVALVNLGITIPLAKALGGVGAAIGTAISLTIGSIIIMNWYYHFKVGLDMKFFWSQIFSLFPALMLPLLMGILVSNFVDLNNLINFIGFGFFYVLIFFLSMWYLGLNKYEKGLVLNPVMKVLSRMFK